MSDLKSLLANHRTVVLSGLVLGVLFRNQIRDFATALSGRLLRRETAAAELVLRPRPLDGVNDGRTVGQKRVESDGTAPAMVNRGRAVGQTTVEMSNGVSGDVRPIIPVHDPSQDTQLWEGRFTDGALKYTVSSFGANYSGSVIGAH